MATQKAFRPGLWMTICTALALIVLLVLGSWQVQRLDWKRDLLNQIETRMAADPIALPQSFDEDLKFQPVALQGAFDADAVDFVFGRSYKGVTGYLLLQVFKTADDRQVLVNRGWLSERDRQNKVWQNKDQSGAGLTEVIGVLRSGVWEGSKMFQPANNPQGDALIFVEPKLVAERLARPDLVPFYLDQIRPENPKGRPVILATNMDIPNNHLQYAITWYAFALILLVIYVLRSRRPIGRSTNKTSRNT